MSLVWELPAFSLRSFSCWFGFSQAKPCFHSQYGPTMVPWSILSLAKPSALSFPPQKETATGLKVGVSACWCPCAIGMLNRLHKVSLWCLGEGRLCIPGFMQTGHASVQGGFMQARFICMCAHECSRATGTCKPATFGAIPTCCFAGGFALPAAGLHCE